MQGIVRTEQAPRPLCVCGNLCMVNNKTKEGFIIYKKICKSCQLKKYGIRKLVSKHRTAGGYIRKDYCERCNFKAEHPCQLDRDHKDGNHGNNDPSNIQTLCANCHRLKTVVNSDWMAHKNVA